MQTKLSKELHRQQEIAELSSETTSNIVTKPNISTLSNPESSPSSTLNLNTGDGLWDWNLQTNEVYFSPRWKIMLGYQDEEIGDSPIEWLHRIHPEDIDKVRAELTANFAGRNPHFENEHRLLHKNGTYRWIRSTGRVIRDGEGQLYHLVGFQTDLTQYKQAVEGLRETNDRFRAIAESIPFPVIVASESDVLIMYVNQSYANAYSNALFALSPEQLIGRSASEFFYNPIDQKTLRETLAKDGFVRHYELPVKRTDGKLTWLDLSIQRLKGNNQNLLLMCFFDITNRKQIEADIDQVVGQLAIAKQYTAEDNNNLETGNLAPVKSKSRPSLTSVFRFIENNYREPIGLREVAQAVGYSPAYLTNLVQHETGRTVNQWIAEYRMAEARLLLLKTNQSVNQVAPAVGYQGAEHFIRQFRQLHGMTPKAWRNQHRG